MLFAKINAAGNVVQFPISENQLRRMFPNVALPRILTAEALRGLDVVLVPPTSVPPNIKETKTHRVQMSKTVTLVDGVYVRQYELAPVPPPEIDARVERRWEQVRARRADLMDQFEWRIQRYHRQVRLGQTPTDNIAVLDAYMQALADITTQPDPFQITWPQVPV